LLIADDCAEANVMARLIVVKTSFNSCFLFKTVKNTSVLMEEGEQQLCEEQVSTVTKTILARM